MKTSNINETIDLNIKQPLVVSITIASHYFIIGQSSGQQHLNLQIGSVFPNNVFTFTFNDYLIFNEMKQIRISLKMVSKINF